MIKKIKNYFYQWRDKRFSTYNFLLNQNFNYEKETLLVEIVILAKNEKEAKEIFDHQIKKINYNLGSNFTLEKVWKIDLKWATQKPLSSLTKEELMNVNFHKNFVKLKEEFGFCKRHDLYKTCVYH